MTRWWHLRVLKHHAGITQVLFHSKTRVGYWVMCSCDNVAWYEEDLLK